MPRQMLVASQVMLSIVLPFVIAPLVYLTSQNQVMMVRNGGQEGETADLQTEQEMDASAVAPQEVSASDDEPVATVSSSETASRPPISRLGSGQAQPPSGTISLSFSSYLRSVCGSIFNLIRHGSISRPSKLDFDGQKSRSFKSHWTATAFGYALCTVVTIANAYVLLMLMIGKG
ncbi:hypothetical protein QFC24_002752 [Naganishia onofrii]|uniref:Uncharacterized protein n=1 Tax=Naganishia onofrii TaxID=1851511 RepID=A0ACC2XRU3_9TREE|nr:hypothetical protein QFC24_002752 [Naganishia onofrii]